jgi:hypothetical protein
VFISGIFGKVHILSSDFRDCGARHGKLYSL